MRALVQGRLHACKLLAFTLGIALSLTAEAGTNAKARRLMTMTTQRPAPIQVVQQILVYDDFDRADTEEPGLGAPGIGEPWIGIGPGGLAPALTGHIEDGRLMLADPGSAAVVYACQVLPMTPYVMEADIVWEAAGGTGAEGTAVMACGPSNTPSWIHNLLHVRIDRGGVAFDTMETLVFHGALAQRSFGGQLALSTPHNVRMTIRPDLNEVNVWVNGVHQFTWIDPRVAILAGPYVFWEMYYNNPTTTVAVTFDRVYAAGAVRPLVRQVPVPRVRDWGGAVNVQ